LLGAGHAHLYTLKRTAEFVRGGCELVLVAPDTFWYSGLATGMLAGIYPPALDQIDVEALIAKGGGRYIRASATRIDVAARMVYLDMGPPLSYDVVSCNLGSEVPLGSIPGAEAHGYAVKPIRNLWHLRQALEARLTTPDQPLQVVVAGGGATACEIALNIRRLVHDHCGMATITVLARGDTVLEQMRQGTSEKMKDILQRRGIKLIIRSPIVQVESQAVVTADGRQVPYDFLVHAIGLSPPALLHATGLPSSEDGALLVDRYLRSVADPRVFGGGDCITFQGRALPRVGVYAVRQAPVLFHNLLATLQGRPLRPFRPQRRFLLILNLGDGTGLATWGSFHWHGRLAFWLKDRIDRTFLRSIRSAEVSRLKASPSRDTSCVTTVAGAATMANQSDITAI
jgi:NADH dehydrogenase FAD-containing subunit